MNKPDIAAIRKRYEAATEGDWFWNSYDAIWAGKGDDSEHIASVSHLEYDDEGDEVPSHGDEIFGPRKAEARANAEFIARARTDLPAVVEALEEAQGKLEAVREVTEDAGCNLPDGGKPCGDCGNCRTHAILGESR